MNSEANDNQEPMQEAVLMSRALYDQAREALRVLAYDYPEYREEYRDLHMQFLTDDAWWSRDSKDKSFKSWIVAGLLATLPKEA